MEGVTKALDKAMASMDLEKVFACTFSDTTDIIFFVFWRVLIVLWNKFLVS